MNGQFGHYDLDRGEVPPEWEGPNTERLELAKKRNTRSWKMLRSDLINARGNNCEYCKDEAKVGFALHHTDYTKGDDPNYLRIACRSCHGRITMFEKTGLILQTDGTVIESPRRLAFLARFRDTTS